MAKETIAQARVRLKKQRAEDLKDPVKRETYHTTIVIGLTGAVIDMGLLEFAGDSEKPPQNAFTCSIAEAERLKK